MTYLNNLAIIPARGGSKGLPGKNIKVLNDKPMIAYTIEAALKSNLFDIVMVSTDDEEIAKIAVAAGAEVPKLRPEILSNDTATTLNVVDYVISEYKKLEIEFNTVCILQPTSPLRKSEDIIGAYDVYNNKGASVVVSVCECEHSPLWENTLPDTLSMANFISPNVFNKRRQDLPLYYRINGAIYICNVDYFIATKQLYGLSSYAYVMDRLSSIDVDTILDFKICELMLFDLEDK